MRIVALIYPYIGVWKELRGVGAAESLNGACKDGQAGGRRAGIGRQHGGEHSAREGARESEGVTHMLHAH